MTKYADYGIECTYCYAGAKELVSSKGKLTIQEHYNPQVNSIIVKGYANGEEVWKEFKEFGDWVTAEKYAIDLLKTEIFEETCPHCDEINEIVWDGKSRKGRCKKCGEVLLYCNICEMETGCGDCPYETTA